MMTLFPEGHGFYIAMGLIPQAWGKWVQAAINKLLQPGHWLTPREVSRTAGAETQLYSKAADLTKTKISEKRGRLCAE